MLPKRFTRKQVLAAVALRYALAPACVVLAALLHLSPAGPWLHPTGLFAIAVLAAAWFGGPGPGFLAAVLATLQLPHLIPMSYPLLGDFLDVPRFITFSIAGLAVGWGSALRARKLRDQERYATAMGASDDGFWDWIPATDTVYASARLLEIYGFPPDTRFAGREDLVRRIPFHPDDRQQMARAIAEHFAGKRARLDIAMRFTRDGETRWVHLSAVAAHDASGAVVRWTGTVRDITQQKGVEEALRVSEQRHARAIEASAAGHWDWNMLTDELFVSERAREMFALPPGRLPPTRTEFLSLMSKYRADMDAGVAASLRTGTFDRVYRVDLPTGGVRWLNSRGKVYKDPAGTPVRMTGSVTDITERKLALDDLRGSEQRYALAMEAAGDGHTDWNLVSGEFYISPRLLEIVGHPLDARFADRADWVRRFPFHPEDRPKWEAAVAEHHAGRDSHFKMELRIVVRGEVRWTAFHFLSTRDASGKPVRWTGSIADITEQKLAEQKLRESEDRFAHAVAGSHDGVWDVDFVGRIVFFSARTRELCGLPPGPEVVPLDGWFEALPLHPEDRPKRDAAVEAHLSGRTPAYDGEFRFLQPDGVYRWRHLHGLCVRDAGGKPLRAAGSISDVDDRRRAEDTLRESEQRYERAMDSSDVGYWDWIPAPDKIYTSPRLLEIYGFAPGTTFAGRNDLLARIPFHPDDRAPLMQAYADHIAGKTARYGVEVRFIRNGETRWVSLTGMTAHDDSGAMARWSGTVRDVTERKRSELALRQSEERYELAMAASESGYWDWDIPAGRYFASPRAMELAGFPPGTTWLTRDEYRAHINMHPEDLARWEAAREALFAGTGERLSMEVRYMVRGAARWHILHAICKRDDTGKVTRWTGSATDITEQKVAEAELASMERKLRQAQRLESMGTFAGGIAHDFNNILGAILGFGEMALRAAPKASRLAGDLESIVTAGERGRALVGRLLAFSRSVVGERVSVHVEQVVREALDLISAKLPPGVSVRSELRSARAAILGDATQVHQVVANLATNAVHAMSAGGTLCVGLANVRVEAPRAATIGGLAAGDYVVLTVADTGAGIPPAIMERIFEPFFTTKEVGTGTGLGLSLVHGIITELGGCIDIVTQVGVGTTFTVYLPRSGDAAETESDAQIALPRGEGQRVLVVDDEEPLVTLATRTLEELGYAPIGFTSSSDALAALRADPQRFDALITDERMPGVSGSTLIREVRGIRSSMPVVLMSGYLGPTADKVRESGLFHSIGMSQKIAAALGADEVLQKPLSARDLATSLAKVLRL